MPRGTVALTGVTGHLGAKVLERFHSRRSAAVLLARAPSKVVAPQGMQVRHCDYAEATGARGALEGVDTLLMVSAAETPDRVDQHLGFIDAAVSAGVRHLVYTSFFGAAPDATFTLARDHWATEEHLRASGLSYTVLRDNLYADFLPLIVVDGAIRGPAGDGRASVVAQDDIADVIVSVLDEPERHAGETYDLTGPEALSFAQMAQVVTQVTGRHTAYVPETLEEAHASRASYGAPDWQVEAWVSTYAAVAKGELERVDDAVPTLTGHPATSLRQVLAHLPRASGQDASR
jgi:NAD(P)H dehydrogenase (quinone)